MVKLLMNINTFKNLTCRRLKPIILYLFLGFIVNLDTQASEPEITSLPPIGQSGTLTLYIPTHLLSNSDNIKKITKLLHHLSQQENKDQSEKPAPQNVHYRIEHPLPDTIQALDTEIESNINEHLLKATQSFTWNKTGEKFRILSLDGGGTRGIIECIILSYLTQITGKPIHQLFDMIIATSTGTLIAAGLATKKPEGYTSVPDTSGIFPFPSSIKSDCYTPEDLAALYFNDGPAIFSKKYWGNGFWGPTYDDTGLNQILKKYFGNNTLKDLSLPIFLAARDPNAKEGKEAIKTFSSLKQDADSSHNAFLRDVLRGCVAAPTIFSPISLHDRVIGDAGVSTNNPAALGLAKAAEFAKVELNDIALFSIGCGYSEDHKSLKEYQAMGKLGWLDHILDTLFDGKAVDQLLSMLQKATSLPSYYFRANPKLPAEHFQIDLTSKKSFKVFADAAVNELILKQDDFYRLAEILTGEKIERKPFFPSIPLAAPSTIELKGASSPLLSAALPSPQQPASPSSSVTTLPPATIETDKKEDEPKPVPSNEKSIDDVIPLSESSPVLPVEGQHQQPQTGLETLDA